MASEQFTLGIDTQQLKRDVDKAIQDFKHIGNTVSNEGRRIDNALNGVGWYKDAAGRLRDMNGKFIKMGDTAVAQGKRIEASFDGAGNAVKNLIAGIAIEEVLRQLYNFSQEFNKSMLEVTTISGTVTDNFDAFKKQVLELTTEIPVQANESAKALYQIVSAGHDGADGMRILEVSAKAAVGGVTETAIAADAITSLMNAYKQDASQAEAISDKLFTTVRLGKTDMTQLGTKIAGVAPMAAAFGIEMEQVLAAISTLTASGTPTAEAVTQIRASIIAANKVLGDGYFQTNTFQTGLSEIATMAGGSESKLRALVPEIEAMNGVLGLTGLNAEKAASHLEEFERASGASEQAFNKMMQDSSMQMTILTNTIKTELVDVGNNITLAVGKIAQLLNEAFASGDIERYAKLLGGLAVTFGTYKSAVVALNAVKVVQSTINKAIIEQTALEMALNKNATREMALQTARTKLLTIAKNGLVTSIKRVTTALLSNPYTLAAVAVAALAATIYTLSTQTNFASESQERLNDSYSEFDKMLLSEQRALSRLKGELAGAEKGTAEYKKIKDQIVQDYGKYYDGLEEEITKIGLTEEAYNKLSTAISKAFGARQYDSFMAEQQKQLDAIMSENLGDIQDRLYDDLGDEEGARVYTKIRRALIEQKELDAETQKIIFNVQDKGTLAADGRLDKYIRNIQKAQKATEEFDQKARVKFGIEESVTSSSNTNENAVTESDLIVDPIYGELYRKAQKEWLEAKKGLAEIEKDKDNFTKKQYENAVNREEETKKAFEELGGNTSANKARIKSESDIAKESLKLQEEAHKAELELKRSQTKDKLVLIEFDRKAQLEAIEKSRKAFEEKYKGQSNTEEYKNALAAFDSKESTVNQFASIGIDEARREELLAMQSFLKEYGTFQQKKLAIAQEYAEKIAKAQSEGEKLSLEKEKASNLAKVEADAIKMNIDWQTAFGEFGNLFSDMIKPTLENAKKYLDTKDFQNASEESKKTLIDAISQMEETVGGSSGGLNFKGLGKDMQVFQEALQAKNDAIQAEIKAYQDLESAQKDYKDALKNGTDEQKETTKKNLEIAEDNATIASENVVSTTDVAKTAQDTLSDTASDTRRKMNVVTDSIQKFSAGGLKNAFDGIINLTKEFAGTESKAGALAEQLDIPIISWILSALDMLQDGLGPLIGGLIDSIFGAINGILSDLFSGDLFVTIGKSIVNGLTGLFNSIFTLGGTFDWTSRESDKNLAEDRDRLLASNENLADALDRLSERMDEARLSEVGELGQRQKEVALEREKNTQELIQREGAAYQGGTGGTHSTNKYIDDAMNASDWQQISDVVGRQIDSAGDFWTLSAEEMAKVRDDATAVYSKIEGLADDGFANAAQYMDDYADMAGEIERINEAINEKLTGFSFDGLVDEFKSALLNMEDDATAFADNFADMMMNSMAQELIDEEGGYGDRLKKWYESYADAIANDGLLSDEEMQALKNEYESIVADAKKDQEQLKEVQEELLGSSDSYDRTSTSQGIATASQDSVDELNGRATAIQGHTYMMSEDIAKIRALAEKSDDSTKNTLILGIGEDIKYLRQNAGQLLQVVTGIKNDTVHLARLNTIETDISSVKTSLRNMETKGITIKK